jgi:MATE family multidrug resistance protein
MFDKMVRLGLPTALQMFFEVTAFAGAAFICGLISAHDIALTRSLEYGFIYFQMCWVQCGFYGNDRKKTWGTELC